MREGRPLFPPTIVQASSETIFPARWPQPQDFLFISRTEAKLEHQDLRVQARMTVAAKKGKTVEECQNSQMYSYYSNLEKKEWLW